MEKAYNTALNGLPDRLLRSGSNTATRDLDISSPMVIVTLFAAVIGTLSVFAGVFLSNGTLALLEYLVNRWGLQYEPGVRGCTKLGLPRTESNLLHDEFDRKYRSGDPEGEGKSWKIKSLWIYPVKSAAGIELQTSETTKTGLKYDRMFSFAKWSDQYGMWKFESSRLFPKMTTIRTEVWYPDASAPGYSPNLEAVKTQGVVRMIFPVHRKGLQGRLDRLRAAMRGNLKEPLMTVELPLQPTPEQIKAHHTIEEFKIWKDQCKAINMSQYMPPELRDFLGVRPDQRFALFRYHEVRELFRDAPRKEVLGWQPVAGFNDYYPVNLLGMSSLQATSDLQPAGSAVLTARRFRANVLVEGTPEFEEERWKFVRLGDQEYYVAARCVRCQLPNVDPDTGVKHQSQPDKTIRAYRNVDKGAGIGNLGCLAVQLVPKHESGRLAVGDVITVEQRGELIYTAM